MSSNNLEKMHFMLFTWFILNSFECWCETKLITTVKCLNLKYLSYLWWNSFLFSDFMVQVSAFFSLICKRFWQCRANKPLLRLVCFFKHITTHNEQPQCWFGSDIVKCVFILSGSTFPLQQWSALFPSGLFQVVDFILEINAGNAAFCCCTLD